MVTIPELEGQQAFLDEMAAVSPRLVIEQRYLDDLGADKATMIADVEVLYTNRAPSHLEQRQPAAVGAAAYQSGFDNARRASGFRAGAPSRWVNVAGAHAVPMAEYCLTCDGAAGAGILAARSGSGVPRSATPAHSPPVELAGRTSMGIVGYGQTGREVARLATAHGMRVLALKRHPEQRLR